MSLVALYRPRLFITLSHLSLGMRIITNGTSALFIKTPEIKSQLKRFNATLNILSQNMLALVNPLNQT
tara:strand:+ start:255 stop:458 length:204 start_codon:yes stop_codon:yes gene_type:complete